MGLLLFKQNFNVIVFELEKDMVLDLSFSF